MELGKATLRGNGLNLLKNGIHPRHGLVWTDGKAIYLAPVRLYGNDIENAKSLKLGEFDNVRSLHWSCDIDDDTCFLCAIHQQNVTVWKVTGSAPKLGFKQVRKINVQPIPQGCLWHPQKDTLCLLGRHQCSFYFRHIHNKSSFAFPQLESGKITCGTWSEDGRKLVVCVGSVVLLYSWADIESSVSDFTPAAWKVPGLDGNLASILPLSQDSLVCAAELPLESLCKQQDMFVVPDVVSSSKDRLLNGNQGEVIKGSDGALSIKDSLLNLERNPQSLVQDTCQLVVIKLRDNHQDPTVATSVNVKGVIMPDVLAHEPNTNSVIVGSNNQSLLQIYTFVGEELLKVSDIQLEKHQRPKGSCRVPSIFAQTSSGVLVVVGERDAADSAFPSSTNEAQYKLQLRYFPVKIDKSHLRNSYSAIPKNTTSDAIRQEQKVKSLSGSNLPVRTTSGSSDSSVTKREDSLHTGPIQISVPTSQSSPRDQVDTKQLVVEMNSNVQPSNLEIETVQFSSQPPRFHNSHVEKFFKDSTEKNKSVNGYKTVSSNSERSLTHNLSSLTSVSRDDGCVLEDSLSDPGNSSSIHSEDGVGCDVLERQVKSQKEQIAALQKKIDILSQTVEDSSCIFPTKYQSPDKPDKVKIICETAEGSTQTRSFLLDAGRLQLDPIKQAFRLATVELMIDGDPCVMGANIDGYIPMKFNPGATLSITGVPACTTPPSPREATEGLRKDHLSGASRC